MTLKVIQINIWKGKFLDRLVEFLRNEQPDIVTMQEVTGGRENHWLDKGLDMFAYCKEALSMDGIVTPTYCITGDPNSYLGNAVFVRGKMLTHAVVWLRPYRDYARTDDADEWPLFPGNVLDITAEIGGKTIHALSTHGAWGKEPADTDEKIQQAKILAAHLRSLSDTPFVLGGDFNMEPGSKTVATIDAVARNIVHGSGITNTLNLRTHYAANVLPRGRLVDFIYVSPHFSVQSIDASEIDISDHLPIRAILTF